MSIFGGASVALRPLCRAGAVAGERLLHGPRVRLVAEGLGKNSHARFIACTVIGISP